MSTQNKTSIEIELKKLNSNFNTFNKIMSSFLVIATSESTFKNKTNKEIQEEALSLMEHVLKERKTQPKWFKIKKEYIKNGRSK